MTKLEFICALQEQLSALPQEDIEERIGFYSEMIDDRMEEGLSEEEAVAAISSPAEIAQQIISETPISKLVKHKIKKKRNPATVTLLAVGAVVWVPLLIAFLAVVFSLYVSMWAVIISLWSVFVSLAASGLGAVLGGIITICTGNSYSGIALIACGLICAGLAILTFYGCRYITKGAIKLTKWMPKPVKQFLARKEES